MKVQKILDLDTTQAYKIINPSKRFKKLFPKKYIYSLDYFGTHILENSNTMSMKFGTFYPIGYIFTYENTVLHKPASNYTSLVSYEDIGSTYARCLDTYFVSKDNKDAEEIDLVLACGCKNEETPPALTEELIIRCNSEKMMCSNSNGNSNGNPEHVVKVSGKSNVKAKANSDDKSDIKEERAKTLKHNILNVVNEYLTGKKYDVEHWIKDIIYNYPTNNNGLPIKFPKKISDKNINSFTLKAKDIFIEYDFRAKDYEHEDEFISVLEDAFESPNETVQISNTYNNILDDIKKKLDEKKYPWKEIDKDTISTKFKHLRDIDVEYQLTDFL